MDTAHGPVGPRAEERRAPWTWDCEGTVTQEPCHHPCPCPPPGADPVASGQESQEILQSPGAASQAGCRRKAPLSPRCLFIRSWGAAAFVTAKGRPEAVRPKARDRPASHQSGDTQARLTRAPELYVVCLRGVAKSSAPGLASVGGWGVRPGEQASVLLVTSKSKHVTLKRRWHVLASTWPRSLSRGHEVGPCALKHRAATLPPSLHPDCLVPAPRVPTCCCLSRTHSTAPPPPRQTPPDGGD